MASDITTVSRILTVAFGAAPMLLWLPLLAIWTVGWAGTLAEKPTDANGFEIAVAFLCIFLGSLGLWGAYSLWLAAIGPIPVARSTAYGLGSGIFAMLATILALTIFSGDGGAQAPDTFALWMAAGPIVVAAWHLFRHVKAE